MFFPTYNKHITNKLRQFKGLNPSVVGLKKEKKVELNAIVSGEREKIN